MKKWEITLEAETEEYALMLLNAMAEAFRIAVKTDTPIKHVYMNVLESQFIRCSLKPEENENH